MGDVEEGNSASFPISLTDSNGNPVNAITDVVVDVTYSGVAIDGTDFTGVVQVTILAGTSSTDLDIDTIDDFIAEGSELVGITISNPVGGGFEAIVVGQATADMNIVDEADPGAEDTITVSIADTVGDVEEGNSASFPISLTDSNGNPVNAITDVVVDVTYSGVAIDGTDFTGVVQVTILAGTSSTDLDIDTIDDFIAEGSELVGITISNPVGGGFEAIVVGQATADMNIVDEADPGAEDTITVSIADTVGDVEEGNSASFPISLTDSNGNPVNAITDVVVDVTYSGVAIDGTDFTGVVQVTILAGTSSTDLDIDTIDDFIAEGSELVGITISNPVGGGFEAIVVGQATADMNIVDEADPGAEDTITVSIADTVGDVEEGNSASFPISLTDSNGNPVNAITDVVVDVTYSGVAIDGTDFTGVVQVTILAGTSSTDLDIDTIDDFIAEGSELVGITISNPVGGGFEAIVVGQATADMNIVDEADPGAEDTITVSIADTVGDVEEGNSASFPISLTDSNGNPVNAITDVVVDVTYSGVAIDGTDFTGVVQVTILAGTSSTDLDIDTIDDFIAEGSELVGITISNPVGGGFEAIVVGQATADMNIVDEADPGAEDTITVSIADTVGDVEEGNSASFPISLTDSNGNPVNAITDVVVDVTYSGVAIDGTDFTGVVQVTILAGTSSTDLDIDTIDDFIAEGSELVGITISNPVGGGFEAIVVGQATADMNIVDEADPGAEDTITVSIADTVGDVEEGNSASFPISLTDSNGNPVNAITDVVVDVTYSGVAIDGTDFTGVVQVTILAGTSSTDLDIDTIDDFIAEGSELVGITISNPVGGGFEAIVVGQATADMNIVDEADPGAEDTITVSIADTVGDVEEGNSASFPISLTDSNGNPVNAITDVVVDVTYSGVAIDGTDFTGVVQVTILAGTSSTDLDIDTIDDFIAEGSELVGITISNPVGGGFEAIVVGQATADMNIVDEADPGAEDTITVSIADTVGDVEEGNSASFPISLTDSNGNPVNAITDVVVDVTYSGVAIDGTDFTGVVQVTILAGTSSTDLDIDTIDDFIAEGSELVGITISNPVGGGFEAIVVGQATADMNIVDEADPGAEDTITVSIADTVGDVEEGNSASFPISLTDSNGNPVNAITDVVVDVTYSGVAIDGTDFTGVVQVTILAGTSSTDLDIDTIDDFIAEGSELVGITISNPVGGGFEAIVVGQATADMNIVDEADPGAEDTITVSIADTVGDVEEGNSASFPISLTDSNGNPVNAITDVVVDVTYSGVAIDGTDFTGVVQVTILAGTSSTDLDIDTIDDFIAEGSELVGITISNPVGGGFEAIVVGQATADMNIVDEADPGAEDTITVSIADTVGDVEEGNSASFPISLTDSNGNPVNAITDVVVDVTYSGVAIDGTDFTGVVQVTILAGTSSTDLDIDTIDDFIAEGSELVGITISNPVGGGFEAIVVGQATADMNIVDEADPGAEDTITVSIADTVGDVEEGNSASFPISLTDSNGNPVNAITDVVVDVTYSGVAIDGTDFTGVVQVTILAGTSSTDLDIDTIDDFIAEGSELVGITISNPVGGGFEAIVVGQATADMNIVDEADPGAEDTITVSIADTVGDVEEGNSASFPISLTDSNGNPVNAITDVVVDVTYSGVAIDGTDFTGVVQVTILAGTSSTDLDIDTIDDFIAEGSELVGITISNPVGGGFEAIVVGQATADMNIVDEADPGAEDTITVSIADTVGDVEEGNSASFPISLTDSNGNPVNAITDVVVDVTYSGVAIDGTDFTGVVQVTILAGTSSTDLDIDTIDDFIAEGSELVGITISNPVGGGFEAIVVGQATADMNIVDEADPGAEDTITVSIADTVGDVEEGNSASFPISLTDSNGNPVNAITDVVVDVTYSGVAIDGTDFTGVVQVTILAGTSSTDLDIDTIDDFIAEGSELVGITISNPVGGGFEAIVVGQATADMNIVDEADPGAEDTITVSIADTVGDVEEGNSASFPVSLTDSNGNPVNAITDVVVDVTYSGVAIDGTDFTGVVQVTILAGTSSTDLDIDTIDDFITEGSELVGITISNPVGGGFEAIVVGQATADMNIVDEADPGAEDTITVSIADTVGDVEEGNSASFPISLTDSNGNPVNAITDVVVDVTYSGVAIDGTDFTGVVQVTILAGTSSTDLDIDTIDDFIAEGSELVGITISNPVGGGFEAIVVGQATADMNIVDEADPGAEDTITVSIADTVGDVEEGNSASFPISLTDSNGNPVNAITDVVVDVTYSGVAIDGTDFTGVVQVTILAGTSSTDLDIDTIDDFIAEGSELVGITISNPVGGGFEAIVVGQATADMNIVDEADPGAEDTITVSIADTVGDVEEGNSASFPISLTDSNGNPVNAITDVVVDVTYSGVAIDGTDFTGVVQVTILAGTSSTDLDIDTIDDFIAEGSELVGITISNPVGGGFEAIVVGQATADMNIVDEADPGAEDTITVSIADTVGDVEEGNSASFPISLTDSNGNPVNAITDVVVDVTYSGVAIDGTDFTGVVQVTILAGTSSTDLDIDTIDDFIAEGSELVGITISNPVGGGFEAIVVGQATADMNIVDEADPGAEDTITVSIADTVGDVEEGNSASFPISLTDSNGNPVNAITDVVVDVTYSGVAIDGTDFTGVVQVTILAGTSSTDLDIDTIDDFIAEGSELVGITISNPVGGGFEAIVVGQATADMNIVDEADPGAEDTITVSIADTVGDVEEGNSASFPISLTDSNGNPVNAITDVVVDVTYSGVAIDGTDFTGVVQVTILAGTSSTDLDIDTIDDFIAEGSELVGITISNPVGGGFEAIVVGQATADMNIVDEADPGAEDTITVSIADTVGDVEEGNSASFPISLTDSNGNPVNAITDVVVDVTYSGVAIDGTDFTGVVQVTILAGTSSTDLDIDTIDDFIAEGSELVGITISNPVGGGFEAIVVGQATADMNIVDEADPGAEDTITVSIADTVGDVEEGNSASFPVSLTDSNGNPVNAITDVVVDVTYSGVAIDGTDFTGVVQVTILAGTSSTDLDIDTIDDFIAEGSELVGITISNPVGGGFEAIVVGQATADMNIVDEADPGAEDTITVSIADTVGDVEEGNSASFPISLTDSNGNPVNAITDVVVDVTYSGVAIDGTDFTGVVQVTILAGTSSTDLDIDTIDDFIAEGSELVGITISNPVGGGFEAIVVGQATADMNIVDNDTVPTISISSTTVSEEGLPGGIPDNDALPPFTDNAFLTTQTGVITVVDPDPMSASDFSVTLNGPTGNNAITSGGSQVTWSQAGNVLTGSAMIGGNPVDVITMTIDAFTDNGNGNYSANYTAELLKPIDHPNTNGEDNLDLSFTATVSDGFNTSSSSVFTLTIEDDSPLANDVNENILVEPVNTNLLLMLDVSGSMRGERLALAKSALIQAISKYDEFGEVAVRLVTFQSTSNIIGSTWLSAADALVAIDNINVSNGFTNYDAALAAAITAFGSSGKIADVSGATLLNKAIFITDGEPNRGNGGPSLLEGSANSNFNDVGIQAAEEAIWTGFLNTNKIDAAAYSIVNLGSNTLLDPIAYDGSGVMGIDKDGVTVTPQTLEDSILNDIDITTLSGNLAGSSSVQFGADGNGLTLTTINIGGVGNFTYNIDTAVLTSTAATTSYSYDMATNTVTVTTTNNGIFVIDFDNADYSYTAPKTVSADYQETISYTAIDNDGDQDMTTLTISLTYDANNSNRMMTSQASRAVDIDDESTDALIGDGSQNIDTLYFDSISIDLNNVNDIEVIEMTNGISQTLSLSLQDVIGITDDDNTLFINGDSANETSGDADKVVLTDFTKAATSNQVGYDLYQSNNDDTMLYIDTDITVI
ncbi:VWA domain-containing protein [Psychrobacter sp. AH5]|uniref:VWA domain-containing protein n=1 Tax=Psychrobacter sp. AH5 TaxID=2937433 RepID=UPI00333E7F8E